MAEKKKLISEEVKYSGYGDLKDAYKYAFDWLKDEEDYDVVEKEYSEKISGNAKDIEFKWECSKKLNDYFKSHIKIKWRVMGMTDVEVEVDGKKKRMNKFADLKISVEGSIENDYDSKWEATPFFKTLRKAYDKYIAPKEGGEMKGKVVKLVQGFKEEMKSFFDLTGKR